MGMRNFHFLKSAVFYWALIGANGGWLQFDATRVASAKPAEGNASTGASSGSGSSTSNTSTSGVASVEPSTPAEKKAAKLAGEATGADYKAGRQPIAEKKLRDAIHICMLQSCSDPFKARLHRDLGFIYVAGLKRVEDGKDEFTAALTTDATVILTPGMENSQATKQAFEDVKAGMASSQSSTNSSDKESSKADSESNDDADVKSSDAKETSKKSNSSDVDKMNDVSAPPESNPAKAYLNWLSLAIEQDLVYHSSTPNACSAGSPYKCYDRNGAPWPPVVDAVVGGNQVNGGLAAGPWRILAGYDRVFAHRFTLGARIGAVVSGKADIVKGDRAVMLFHGEARAGVWLARDPFAGTGLRPYVFLSGGVAEADSMVLVEYSQCSNCELKKANAWKRSGPEFAGVGAGVKYAITPRMGPILEARYMQFFDPSVPVIGLQLGYAFGL